MSEVKTAIGYVRVSTTKDEQATSPENQRAMIKRECEREGWKLVRFFEDRATGTNTEGRPDFREMEEYIQTNDVDVVVVVEVSRLARRTIDYLQFCEVLEKHGVRLRTIHGINGEGQDVDLVRGIQALLAEQYCKEVSRKVRAAHNEHSARGFWISTIPFGYRSSKGERSDEPCKLLKDPEQWPVVETIFNLAADGVSSRQIAKRLNTQGLPAARGGQWSVSSVHRVRSNRVYCGDVPHNGGYTKGAHDCVIDPDTWERAQDNAQRARHSRTKPGKYLLAALGTSHYRHERPDGSPGPMANLHGETQRGKRYYRVDSRVRSGVVRLHKMDDHADQFPTMILADPLEYAVIAKLTGYADETDAPGFWGEINKNREADAERARNKAKELETEMRNTRMQLAKLRQRLDRALDYELKDEAQRYGAEIADAELRLKELAAELADALAQAQLCEDGAAPPEALMRRFNLIKELWELDERQLLRKYLSRIIDRIDLRTDGEHLVGTVYLRNLPELASVQCTGGGGIRTPVTGIP